MGNWRTVQIEGTVSRDQANEMIRFLTAPDYSEASVEEIERHEQSGVYYLSFGIGLAGIGQWVRSNGEIKGQGNLFERDCTLNDLKKELDILTEKFDSLEMKLHAGGDYEDEVCVASFIISNGKAEQVEPLIEKVNGASVEQMRNQFLKQLLR